MKILKFKFKKDTMPFISGSESKLVLKLRKLAQKNAFIMTVTPEKSFKVLIVLPKVIVNFKISLKF